MKKLLKTLKKESEKRRDEDIQKRVNVKSERKRLEEIRASAQKNIFRKKIKFIDNIQSKIEQEKDEKYLADFEASENARIEEARKERKREIAEDYTTQIAIAFMVVILIGVAAIVGGVHMQRQAALEKYNQAVECVLDNKYENATALLKDNKAEGAKSLLNYCQLECDKNSYKGKSQKYLKKLKAIGTIADSSIQNQYNETCGEVTKVVDVQKDIDSVKLDKIDENSEEMLNNIGDEIESIDKDNQELLDKSNYDSAVDLLENIEDGTDLGKTIVAINSIGKVSLNSKDTIEDVRTDYDDLSESDQEKVANYELLTAAEQKLEDLEAGAEEEQTFADKRQKNIENSKVFITYSGSCYHIDGCRMLKSTAESMTIKDAESRGYKPCGICNPKRYY